MNAATNTVVGDLTALLDSAGGVDPGRVVSGLERLLREGPNPRAGGADVVMVTHTVAQALAGVGVRRRFTAAGQKYGVEAATRQRYRSGTVRGRVFCRNGKGLEIDHGVVAGPPAAEMTERLAFLAELPAVVAELRALMPRSAPAVSASEPQL